MIVENKLTAKVEAILENAGEIFAAQGFRRTTIREICKRCKVNLAAINYYFGSKEQLYLACLKYYQSRAVQNIPSPFEIDPSAQPQERLSAYIKAFIFRLLEEDKQTLFGKLLAREFFEPTGALDILIEESIKPSFYFLTSLVRDVVGDQCPTKIVELCAMSIVGQCLYFRNAQPVIFALRAIEKYSEGDIQEIADHIINFSLKALTNYFSDRS